MDSKKKKKKKEKKKKKKKKNSQLLAIYKNGQIISESHIFKRCRCVDTFYFHTVKRT